MGNLPFDLPELSMWGWAAAAMVGAFLAWFVASSSHRSWFTSTVAVIIGVLSAMCGVMAIFKFVVGS
jgi:hypothetical protein